MRPPARLAGAAGDWPIDVYVVEPDLAELIETHDLELADNGQYDLVLRAVPEPWPFPAHLRMVPDVVAALDLTEATSAPGSRSWCPRRTAPP